MNTGNYVNSLKAFPWRSYGVDLALLFGSRVHGKVVKGDWDIAVWLRDTEMDIDLQYALAKFLNTSEYTIDLVLLNNYEHLPCTLIVNILGKGRIIYYSDADKYLDLMVRILGPCLDFIIDSEKLNLLETQINAVMKRWGR